MQPAPLHVGFNLHLGAESTCSQFLCPRGQWQSCASAACIYSLPPNSEVVAFPAAYTPQQLPSAFAGWHVDWVQGARCSWSHRVGAWGLPEPSQSLGPSWGWPCSLLLPRVWWQGGERGGTGSNSGHLPRQAVC